MCVCLLVTFVSSAKTAEPIEMPFRELTRVGPGKHLLDNGQCRTNPFAAVNVDNTAMRPFVKTLTTYSYYITIEEAAYQFSARLTTHKRVATIRLRRLMPSTTGRKRAELTDLLLRTFLAEFAFRRRWKQGDRELSIVSRCHKHSCEDGCRPCRKWK